MISKGSAAYGEIRGALTELLNGSVLSIDPSIGSQSSMPAWAWYDGGVFKESGVIEIDCTQSTPERLQRLNYSIRRLIREYDPDVMVYEAISDAPFKGFSSRGHAPLMKALGAILSVSGPDKYVGMLAGSWKKCARPTYTKSDENDAIEIGWVAIDTAKRLLTEDPPGAYGKKRKQQKKKEG